MKLWEAEGKTVKIVLDNKLIIQGKAYDYISEADNTPPIASITVGGTEIYEIEIKSIELV